MKLLRTLTFALAALACSTAGLQAQGVIVPRPCDRCPPPGPGQGAGLPVESVTFETTIQGQVATTHVTQVFRNPHSQVMEGTYFFPLPEDASITEFAIWDGDRRLQGEVRPREEARRIYEDIVRRVRDPGLLEYAGQNLFQARIFPIPGRGTKKLELTYTQVLRAENGTVGYRYPLGIGRNASRIERFSGRVALRAGGGLRTGYSTSHDVDVRIRTLEGVPLTFRVDPPVAPGATPAMPSWRHARHALVATNGGNPGPGSAVMGEAGEGYEGRLDRIRRIVGEERFALGVQLLTHLGYCLLFFSGDAKHHDLL